MANPIQDNVAKALELDALSEEEKQEVIQRVGVVIYQNMLVRALETMSDEDQDEFEKILDQNGQPDQVFAFLRNKVPNLEQIIEEETLKFKNNASNIMDQIGE